MNNVMKVPADSAEQWTKERIDLLVRTICRGATKDELDLFLNICKRTQLDPFQKQIYAVKRWDSTLKREVMSAQTSIDGLRLIAERSGEYDGQEGPFWCGKDGVWVDVWLKEELPMASKVIVYKKGVSRGTSAVAHFTEHAQYKKDGGLTKTWEQMPALMLAKCAESLSLRKAFPNDLSGLYSLEEFPAPTIEKTKPYLDRDSKPGLPTNLTVVEEHLDPVPVSLPGKFGMGVGPVEKLPFEEPPMVAGWVIPSGSLKGKKLSDLGVLECQEYIHRVEDLLASGKFPAEHVSDAEQIIDKMREYLLEVS